MKAKRLLIYAFALVLPLLVSSCSEDNSKPEPLATMTLPSTEFGRSMGELQRSEEQRGFTVVETDSIHLTLTKTESDAELKYIYSFDPTTGEYRYAKGKCADDNQLAVLTLQAGKAGYALQASANSVTILADGEQNSIIINTRNREFFAIPSSGEALAWGRFDNLSDAQKAGLIVPYLGKYASLELVELAEQYNGNTLDEANTKVDRGVYVYNVANNSKGYTKVKYWFDVDTKTKLEEAAIYFEADMRPSTAAVAKYMNYLGLEYTSLTDPRDGSSIYYNYDQQYEAYLLMNKPEDETVEFAPCIQFAFADLSAQVPPATVSLPEPVVDFSLTLDEAIAQYQTKDFYTGIDEDDPYSFFGAVVTTSSPDFPKIILMEDEGRYIASIMVVDEAKVLRSPSLKTWFSAHNYTYDESISVLPSYLSADGKVLAQFDLDGAITGGLPCLAFQTNE